MKKTVGIIFLLICLYPFQGFAQESFLDELPFDLNGFIEGAVGLRTQDDPQQSKDFSIAEGRLQLEAFKGFDWADFKYRGDLIGDGVLEEFEFDLREANMAASPLEFLDVKIGRQILTWGTGDLVFLNDLFPKDFQSFFIGRDDEYLKAPSDAAKFSFFFDIINMDVVWTPRFNEDRFITGERLSYFNSILGRKAGEKDRLNHDEPDEWVEDSEVALRLFKNIKGYELALYGYYGFFKNPGGVNTKGQAIFPRLAVYGASIRGSLAGGIANLETAYYDSLKDKDGSNPAVDNGQLRFLAGYTREVFTDFSAGVQYNLEHRIDHDNFVNSLPSGSQVKDENRHVLTLRLTQLLLQQNLRLSIFTFYSPSDKDAHFRPNAHYKIGDSWSATLGGNIFVGKDETTFFGQLEDNTNVYTRLRYSF